MTIKEEAKHIIDQLPDDATFEDIRHAIYVRSRLAEAEAQAARGQMLTHEQVKQRVDAWRK
jgi:predicted transcriptional regulator